MKKGLYGAKPMHFNNYILELLQYKLGDELIDVFPGTEGMSEAIKIYESRIDFDS